MVMSRGKTIRIDVNAHRILVNVKEEMKEEGIGSPTLSDAVRRMNRKLDNCYSNDEEGGG
ncbi:hypothetical protein AKJ40_03835 [candidate division MSBL1 archaeon SCGC-AAA259M10]|uniref:Uncharacterized protein n=1 Tax=candidate division MSBL1 archaeon SCGC-AAA259M10 TaxID=1698270 RepID=A0A133UY68_9EURY|nr:hypothetical protein AKJ40_03835 [candidate division MSBL1 archaeon SCGC-AAA259M10]